MTGLLGLWHEKAQRTQRGGAATKGTPSLPDTGGRRGPGRGGVYFQKAETPRASRLEFRVYRVPGITPHPDPLPSRGEGIHSVVDLALRRDRDQEQE